VIMVLLDVGAIATISPDFPRGRSPLPSLTSATYSW
jgi:hypothetical protein